MTKKLIATFAVAMVACAALAQSPTPANEVVRWTGTNGNYVSILKDGTIYASGGVSGSVLFTLQTNTVVSAVASTKQTNTVVSAVASTLATNTIVYLDASTNVVTNTFTYVSAVTPTSASKVAVTAVTATSGSVTNVQSIP